MAQEPEQDEEYVETSHGKGGQILGCIFALITVGAIFLFLFVFMSSC
jgi:hypothetical protein